MAFLEVLGDMFCETLNDVQLGEDWIWLYNFNLYWDVSIGVQKEWLQVGNQSIGNG